MNRETIVGRGQPKRAWAFVIAVIAPAVVAVAASGTPDDVQRVRGYFREVETLCNADGGQLWGVSLKGPMMFVDPATRAVFANQADAEGRLKQEGDVFVGTLPANVPIANTTLKWAGTHWTQVMWPPPADDVNRRVLLMHESWHRVQDQCGLPASSPPNGHLNTFDGRFWIQLEWRALDRALRTSGEERRAAIEDALLFRRARHQLVESAAEQECALETAEGLAEYTGIRLSGMSTDERLAFAACQLAQRPAQFPTFNRSFAYLTGPAYALLLDTTDQPWRAGLAAGANLADRLRDLLDMKLPEAGPDDLASRAERYDGSTLRTAELEREEARRVRHAALHKQYFEDAVLTFPLDKIQLTFDPRNIETVGEVGTYYPTLIISDRWGKLTVTQGAFLSADFKTVRVVAPTDPAASELSGTGWKLELDPGWQMIGDERPGCYRLVALGFDAPAHDALEKALGAVFRITNGRTAGTGFLVAMPGRVDDAAVILVTAAHVFEEMSEAECQLILRTRSADQTYARKELSIAIREHGAPRWKRHAEMDVAALEIRLPADVAVTPLDYEQLADAAWVADKNLRVGQQVWIASYPAQLAANEAGWPIVRHGAVASHPLSPVAQNKTMLIDFNTFGGDSGAPVFAVSNDRCHVIGLVHGMHRQTDKASLPLQELTFHTPLGLSIVVQAAFLRDTIELLKPSAK